MFDDTIDRHLHHRPRDQVGKSVPRVTATGRVALWNDMKGFGFIARDDGKPDVYVHVSAVKRSGLARIDHGQRIRFDIVPGDRDRPKAVNLKLLDFADGA